MNKIVTVACIAGMLSLIGLAVKSIAQETPATPATPTIWTDQTTLCQYVITPQGGIERRMVDNGVIYFHMGCKPNPAVVPKK